MDDAAKLSRFGEEIYERYGDREILTYNRSRAGVGSRGNPPMLMPPLDIMRANTNMSSFDLSS
jgi:hypothetical protein